MPQTVLGLKFSSKMKNLPFKMCQDETM